MPRSTTSNVTSGSQKMSFKKTFRIWTDIIRGKNSQQNRKTSLGSQGLYQEPEECVSKEDEIINRVRRSVECPICTDVYLDPVNLQCGHTFCLHCLARDYTERQGCRLICCICRDENTKTIVISRCLRDVIGNAFAEEERHRRETLTPSDRQAVAIMMSSQLKTPPRLSLNTDISIRMRYIFIGLIAFLIWFFYLE